MPRCDFVRLRTNQVLLFFGGGGGGGGGGGVVMRHSDCMHLPQIFLIKYNKIGT